MTSRAFSLGTGILKEILGDEDLSAIDTIVGSRIGGQADILSIADKMTMRRKETLRLNATRVMQRLHESLEEANLCRLLAAIGNRGGNSPCCWN
jgi:Glu-tRNA(Gln) amidotransferase subunit E-like FAD-binding protein